MPPVNINHHEFNEFFHIYTTRVLQLPPHERIPGKLPEMRIFIPSTPISLQSE